MNIAILGFGTVGSGVYDIVEMVIAECGSLLFSFAQPTQLRCLR